MDNTLVSLAEASSSYLKGRSDTIEVDTDVTCAGEHREKGFPKVCNLFFMTFFLKKCFL